MDEAGVAIHRAAMRLARDALWDEEVASQADGHALNIITVDGSIPATDLAGQLATHFGLGRTA